ncbi:hypothetical protein [Paenibacillus pinisoli]|nr:hypothetical protein [Paenibacillus pinisoli]
MIIYTIVMKEGAGMKREDFDARFDHALSESAKLTRLVPDHEESWIRIQKKLAQRDQMRKGNRVLKLLPYAVASFLLGAFLFGTPLASSAIHSIAAAFKQDHAQNVNDTPTPARYVIPKTAPPPDVNYRLNGVLSISKQSPSGSSPAYILYSSTTEPE